MNSLVRRLKIAAHGLANLSLLRSLTRQSLQPSLLNLLRASGGEPAILFDTEKFLAFIDTPKLAALRNSRKASGGRLGPMKYFDAPSHLARSVSVARILNLPNSTPLDILDIGAGAGYFSFVCQRYGHQASSLDVSDEPLYAEMRSLLGVGWMEHRVEFGRPFPAFQKKFDLIVCLQIVFDRSNGKPWTPVEWSYFLAECHKILRPGGRLFLDLNTFAKGEALNRREVIEFFRSRGAEIRRQAAQLTF